MLKYLYNMKKSLSEFKKQYESICNEYINIFAKKQNLDFDGWISDDVGGIALFSCQYSFSF